MVGRSVGRVRKSPLSHFGKSSENLGEEMTYLFRGGVGADGEVRDHFLIRELISLCTLNNPIQDKHVPIRFAVENTQNNTHM